MKNNIFDLTGQVALVAGGSSGLGLQFAKAMANAGANVAIVARRTDRLEKNAKEIAAEYGVEVYPHYLDLCDSKSVTKCVRNRPEGVFIFAHVRESAGALPCVGRRFVLSCA